jgi:hypothetical protein
MAGYDQHPLALLQCAYRLRDSIAFADRADYDALIAGLEAAASREP